MLDHDKAQLWQKLIQEQQQSELSIRAWCAQKQLRENRFFYWKRRLAEQSESAVRFVEISPTSSETFDIQDRFSDVPIRIQYHDFQVSVGTTATQNQLLAVLAALQQSC